MDMLCVFKIRSTFHFISPAINGVDMLTKDC
jgi:hypothetical protein